MATKLEIFRIENANPLAGATGALPNRFKVLGWGANANTKGRPLIVSAKTAQALPALQRARGHEKVALDFEHNTVPGSKAYKESQEPRAVASFNTLEVVEGEGVFFNVDRWTPEGIQGAPNFQDISPAVEMDDQGHVVFIHSAGLCRNGSVYDLEFFNADFDQDEAGKKAGTDPDPAEVKPDADAAQLATLAEAVRVLTEKVNALAAAPAPKAETFTAALDGVTSKLTALETEWRTERDLAARRELLAESKALGKVQLFNTVEDTAKLDLPTLKDVLSRAPRAVSLERQTPARVETFKAEPDATAAKARADKVMAAAQELQRANPRWGWPQCWAKAEKDTA